MPKLIILKGLPASGKSSYAVELLKDPAYRRVNKDAFRVMLNNYDYPNSDEKLVHHLYLHTLHSVLKAGYNAIADATNLAASNEKELRMLARIYNADVEVAFFDTDVEECIRRDAERTGHDHVGEEVIRNFHDRFLKNRKFFNVENPLPEDEPSELEKYSHTAGLPWAILCDLDGTLADMAGKRGPFEWKKCINDDVREAVADVLEKYDAWNQLGPEKTQIIFMSGRDAVCRPETEEWIEKLFGNKPDHLYMRAEGDSRKDNIVKYELFNEHIRGKFNVRFVLDDRNQVVEMWRELGLDCFQVAPGDF